jgi:hypothetical protein
MRTTAGTLVTTIVGATGLATWPELVMVLGGGLSSSDAATVHGVLDTLAKIVEDHPEQVGRHLPAASSNRHCQQPMCLQLPLPGATLPAATAMMQEQHLSHQDAAAATSPAGGAATV